MNNKGKGIIQLPLDDLLAFLNIYGVEFDGAFVNHRENTLDIRIKHDELPVIKQGEPIPNINVITNFNSNDGMYKPIHIKYLDKKIDCTYNK